MIRHYGPISGVASSKNFVATAGYDNQVILWDKHGSAALARGTHDHLANRCEISPDERFLVSASSDYTARLFDLPSMQLKVVYGDHEDDVETAKFSPDGQMIATTSQDGRLRVFALDGRLLNVFAGHAGCVSSCGWSEDGERVVSAGDDGTIRTWSLVTGQMIGMVTARGVQTDVVAIGRGGTIYAGNDAGELIVMNRDQIVRTSVHRSGIKNLALNAKQNLMVSVGYDRELALSEIDGDRVRISKRLPIPSAIWVRACAFEDDDTLIFGTFGSRFARLDLRTEVWDLSGVNGTPCLNAVTADGETLYAVGDSGVVRSASLPSTKMSTSLGSMGSLCNWIIRHEGRILCGGHLGEVYDARTGQVLFSHGFPINTATSVQGQLILASYTGSVIICEGVAGGTFRIAGEYKLLANAVKDLAVDGDCLFAAGAAADLVTFDLLDRKVTSYREHAHANIINGCVSLGAGRFATVSRDKMLKIWRGADLESTHTTPHDHSIKCAASSSDGRFIATGSYDGKFAIFDVERGEWPVFGRPTAAGLSNVTYHEGSFYACSYDGNVYRTEV